MKDLNGQLVEGSAVPMRYWTARESTLSPRMLRPVLALNNRNVPACNHLEMATLLHIVTQSSLLAVIEDVSQLKAVSSEQFDDADATVVGFLICMAHGADYGSPNYQYFDRMFADEKDYLYVDRIVIEDAFHGRGFGRRMYGLVDALGASMEPPMKHLCCEVNVKPRNDGSLEFHSKCGFRPVGEQDVDGGKKRVAMLVRPIQERPQ
jgi:predicted GNAT superfamily acetyltransferase